MSFHYEKFLGLHAFGSCATSIVCDRAYWADLVCNDVGDVVMAAFTLRDVTLGYDGHPAVHHLDGEISKGSLTAIVGPNGSGKSTLLKGLVGALEPMGGSIERIGFHPDKF